MWSTGFGGAIDVGVSTAKHARYGDIALMHTRNQPAIPAIKQEESWDMTITAQILPYFAEQGIECVTLSRLYDDLIREQQQLKRLRDRERQFAYAGLPGLAAISPHLPSGACDRRDVRRESYATPPTAGSAEPPSMEAYLSAKSAG